MGNSWTTSQTYEVGTVIEVPAMPARNWVSRLWHAILNRRGRTGHYVCIGVQTEPAKEPET